MYKLHLYYYYTMLLCTSYTYYYYYTMLNTGTCTWVRLYVVVPGLTIHDLVGSLPQPPDASQPWRSRPCADQPQGTAQHACPAPTP